MSKSDTLIKSSNNFTNEFLNQVNSIDTSLYENIIDNKTYKLRLNGRAKSFLKNMKTNTNYSDNYISKLVTKIRGKIKEINNSHPMLRYFKLKSYEYEAIAKKKTEKLKERNANKKSFNSREFLILTEELLLSNRFELLYMGLLLASGRRSLELIAGSFSQDNNNRKEYNNILFQGQLKTRDPKRFNTPYSVPLTIDKNLFLSAYSVFVNTSQYKEIRKQWEDKKLSDYAINQLLKRELIKLFDSKFLVSDFRAIYTTIILKREGYFNDSYG
ncbi:hypothetical protein F0310_05680, partial (plasmid) [Borrelia sp. A-FGy1]|uniref:protelomerase family protein n=1 Tax=Borrelia sp. A-FGy1 TaxID=2608247 RepID=UPI0015F7625C